MAEYLVSDAELTEIADKLRDKDGSSAPIPFSDFADKIEPLADVSDSTVEPGDVAYGKVFYNANGERKVGTMRPNLYYCTCATAAATAAKVASCSDTSFTLSEGVMILVKFLAAQTYNATTAAPLTINVNSTGAVPVMRQGTTVLPRYAWQAGEVLAFVYDGTNFIALHGGLATTTYYGQTKLTNSTASTSTSTAATPNSVKLVNDRVPTPTAEDAGKILSVGSDGAYTLINQ